jgi:ribosome-associated translation inhibitor RaiA
MQIEVIDQQQVDPTRLKSVFTERALRALDRLAPAILRLVGRFRDLNGPKGGVDHACTIEVALRDGTTFRAEARASLLLNALDNALGRLVRRMDSARKRELTRRRGQQLAWDGPR